MTISANATATNTAQVFTVAQNINMGETNTGTGWTTQTINSLRNAATTTSGTTLTIAAANTITIATGGILYGSAVGGNSIITGGTIIPGLGKELVVFVNGNKSLTINSVLGESAAGITDVTFRGNIGIGAGANDLVLGANNTYTGNTYISGLRVRTSSASVTTPFGTGTNGNVYIYGNNGGQFYLPDNAGSLTRNWYVIGAGWEEGSGQPGAFHGVIRLGANTTLGGTLNLMGDASVRATGAFATVSAKLYGNYDLTARSGWGDGTISFTADNTGWAGSYTIGSGGYRFDTVANLGSPTVIQLGNFGSIIPGFTGIQAAVIDKVGYGSFGTIALRVATQNEALDFRSANAAGLVLGANENLTYNGSFFPNVQNGQPLYRLGGGGATLTFANSITGNAALVLTGASANNTYGNVTLNPAVAGGNTYQGGTRVAENGPYGGIIVAAVTNPWSVFGNGQIDFLSLNTNFQLASTITNANGDISSATNFTRVILSGGLKFDTNRVTDFDTVVFAKGVGFYGVGQLTKQGRGTLQLNSVNTYLGNTNIGSGGAGSSILMLNNANPFNVGYSVNGTISGALVNFNNETNPVLQLATNATIPALQASAVTVNPNVLAGPGTLNLAGFTLTVGGSGSGVMTGWIYGGTGLSGTGGITKNGSGNLTFASDRTGNYTGATTILGGTLTLNYNTLTTAPTTLINPLSVLVLGGGTLTQTPKTTQTASHTQTFASTTIAPGGSITTKGAPTALFGTTLALGAITRQTGGAVDFGIVNNGTGFTTGSSAAGLDAGGLLGGWATTNSGASWATLTLASGGNVVANTVNTAVFTGGATTNVDSPSVTTIGASPVTINSLRFNSAASVSLDLAGGLTIASGGVLMTPTVGANAVTLTGGTLTTTSPDLIFQVWDANAASFLSIGSKVTGNIGVTKVGPGTLILKNGANDFVGTVNIGGSGNFRIEGTGTPLGNVANVVNLNSAAQFQLDGGLTISNPVNIKNASGRSGEATVFLTASSGSSTFSGPLYVQNTTVAGGLFGSNGATLNVTGPITAAPGQVVSTRVGTISYAGGGSYDYFFAMQGTTMLGANNGLATTSATSGSIAGAIVDVASAGTSVFDLNGFSQTVAGLTRISGNSATITNSSAAASTLTVNVAASNGGYYTGDFSYAGQLTGKLALVKSGAGIQFISGVNSFTGGTTITAGTLRIGNANALGGDTGFNGLLTINGGTLDIYGTGNAAIGALAGSGGVITDTGFQLGSSVLSTYSVASSAYAGSINDGNFRTLSLYKDGTGILALTGASTYSGVTKIFEGALSIGNNTALGSAVGATIVSSGAAVQVTGGITSAEAFTVSGTGLSATSGVLQNLSGDNTLSGAITVTTASRFGSDAGTLTLSGALTATNLELAFGGAGNVVVSGAMSLGTAGVTKDGLGTLTLSGANTYAGATAVTAGALRIANASALGTTSSLVVTAGAALQIAGGVTYTGVAATTPILQNISGNNAWSVALRPTNGGALTLRSDAGVLTLNGLAGSLNAQSADSVNRALVLTGAGDGSLATNFVNAVSLTKSGAGVWSFDSAQTYAIETAINGGTIKAGANGYLSANSVVRFANVAGAQLDLNGTTQSVATLEGAGATGGAVLLGLNGELTVGANSAFGGSVDGSGTSKLIKTGTGSFTMGPTSALTGTVAVNVNGGTLSFGGNAGANITANVASGAILGGSGTFLGSVNVANGGKVQAGNGVSGSLAIANLVLGTISGNLSTLQFRNIDLGASASVMNIGTLTANGGVGSVSISAINGGALANGTYDLANFTNAVTDFTVFTVGSISGLGGRQSGTLVTSNANKLSVLVAGDSVRWHGAVGATPDTAWHLPGGALNLRLVPGGGDTDYRANDAIIFNDLAASGTVVISEGNVSPSSLTIDNSAVTYAFSGAFGITGATGIVKNGAGAASFDEISLTKRSDAFSPLI
jgi:autotransporter-associated beta strand protein